MDAAANWGAKMTTTNETTQALYDALRSGQVTQSDDILAAIAGDIQLMAATPGCETAEQASRSDVEDY